MSVGTGSSQSSPGTVTPSTSPGVDSSSPTKAKSASGSSSSLAPTSTSLQPFAKCKDVIVEATSSCQAAANIDNGSIYGSEDEITQTPKGPYVLGKTSVQLTITAKDGSTDSCAGTVTVIDDEEMKPEYIDCGHRGIVSPCQTPFRIIPQYLVPGMGEPFLKSNGCPVSSANIHYQYCKACNGNDKEVHRGCGVSIEPSSPSNSGIASIAIDSTGGVGDHIAFSVSFQDNSGQPKVEKMCTLCVETPVGGCHHGLRGEHGQHQQQYGSLFSCGDDWTAEKSFACNSKGSDELI